MLRSPYVTTVAGKRDHATIPTLRNALGQAMAMNGGKSVAVAYVLLLLAGLFGAHRFYLGERGTATALLVVTLTSLLLTTVGIGFFTIGIAIVWVVIDLALVPRMARARDAAA